MIPHASARLVDHALALRWADISPAVTSMARTFLHDTLCVGVAGRHAAHADAVLTTVRTWGAGNQASVLGRPGVRLPAASAAFINAFQIHGQEFDCVHEPAVLHPMATVVAAALAEAERGPPISGATLLTAIIAGVDVAVTLGIASTGPLTFFRPATAGIFGCVAAIANMRRLPRSVALDAFGHALAFASGTMQPHVEGKPALPVQVANAARAALVAVELARGGVPGVAEPIEGTFGYFALLERGEALDAALAKLGRGHRIVECSWKPFPTGRAAHGGIVAVQHLMTEHAMRAETLNMLEFHAPPLIHKLVGRPAFAGMEPGYARLCLAWLAAVTLMRGTVTLQDFDAQTLRDPRLIALAARVRVVANANPDPAAFVPAQAIARSSNRRETTADIIALLGSPDWPLTAQQHRTKARACLAFAGLGRCDDALCAAIDGLDEMPDAVDAIRATGVMG
ncbi:MmgE/PrpD family protein [Sphingomonas sp. 28-63-12]|uniref:MmgE/PrpD family protein n=1 Tax=Sphingomonas sp. 28-63-12 TaxID=1970434 RepID=UPI000BCA4073|nr:MAG: 2-methylcitrate dehydratase [Sphingomonas sp. 28-63-12]